MHRAAEWTKNGFKVTGTGLGQPGERLSVATSSGRVCLRVVWSRPLPSRPGMVTVYRDPVGPGTTARENPSLAASASRRSA